jgi:hypothetical protein
LPSRSECPDQSCVKSFKLPEKRERLSDVIADAVQDMDIAAGILIQATLFYEFLKAWA